MELISLLNISNFSVYLNSNSQIRTEPQRLDIMVHFSVTDCSYTQLFCAIRH